MKNFKSNEELFKFISDNIMDTQEVLEYLGIVRSRLYALIDDGKIIPLRKGVYLRANIEARQKEQGELREKYYRPKK